MAIRIPRLLRVTAIGIYACLAACAINSTSVEPDQSSDDESRLEADQYTGAIKDYTDVWDRVRDGFRFPAYRDPYVSEYEKWYSSRPEYLERMAERAGRYLFYIVEELEQNDFPMEIALLPAVESAYKTNAYSRAHAAGLWQFIPATGRRYGLKQNWWYDGRYDVVAATGAAIQYLDFLNAEFDGDWFHALASYNTGERRVMRAIAHNRKSGRPTSYGHLRLRNETKRYIPKLIALKNIVANPAKYGVELPKIPNQPYFEEVPIGSQLDLSVAAELSATPVDEIRTLNRGFRRWATDPEGPHRLLIPSVKKDQFVSGLAALPKRERVRWAQYRIRRGDTLGHISRRFGVSVRSIQVANKLSGSFIREGRTLVIPLSNATLDSSTLAYAGITQDPLVHRVRRGDTLWGIAKRYNVYVAQLRRWNTMDSGDLLHLGQRILVYVN